jgi:hypothetical protein
MRYGIYDWQGPVGEEKLLKPTLQQPKSPSLQAGRRTFSHQTGALL